MNSLIGSFFFILFRMSFTYSADNLHDLSMYGWIQKNYKFSTEMYKIEKSSLENLEKDL